MVFRLSNSQVRQLSIHQQSSSKQKLRQIITRHHLHPSTPLALLLMEEIDSQAVFFVAMGEIQVIPRDMSHSSSRTDVM